MCCWPLFVDCCSLHIVCCVLVDVYCVACCAVFVVCLLFVVYSFFFVRCLFIVSGWLMSVCWLLLFVIIRRVLLFDVFFGLWVFVVFVGSLLSLCLCVGV